MSKLWIRYTTHIHTSDQICRQTYYSWKVVKANWRNEDVCMITSVHPLHESAGSEQHRNHNHPAQTRHLATRPASSREKDTRQARRRWGADTTPPLHHTYSIKLTWNIRQFDNEIVINWFLWIKNVLEIIVLGPCLMFSTYNLILSWVLVKLVTNEVASIYFKT